jgi:hypothetical protein
VRTPPARILAFLRNSCIALRAHKHAAVCRVVQSQHVENYEDNYGDSCCVLCSEWCRRQKALTSAFRARAAVSPDRHAACDYRELTVVSRKSRRPCGGRLDVRYRLGRSPAHAMRKVWREISEGNPWILNADLRSYFDQIDQERLVDLIAEEISDGRAQSVVAQ